MTEKDKKHRTNAGRAERNVIKVKYDTDLFINLFILFATVLLSKK